MVQQLPNQWDIQGQTLGALGLHQRWFGLSEQFLGVS
jgi:hypothetical protein